MTDDDGTVVAFPIPAHKRSRNEVDAKFDELPLRVAPYSKVCDHKSSIVDAKARTLTCSKCGVPLDPFDVLGNLAYQHERYVRLTHELMKDVDDLARKKRQLERDEQNAKSRIRTAYKTLNRSTGERAALEAAAAAFVDRHTHLEWEFMPADIKEKQIERIRPSCLAYAAAL